MEEDNLQTTSSPVEIYNVDVATPTVEEEKILFSKLCVYNSLSPIVRFEGRE